MSAWNMSGIYAISFAGHGNEDGYEADSTKDWLVSPGDVTINYHLASVHAYCCNSADPVSDANGRVSRWSDYVSANGSFVGYEGSAWHWSTPVTGNERHNLLKDEEIHEVR